MEKKGWKQLTEDTYSGCKSLPILDMDVKKTSEGVYITGYANTKGNEDAYGDIPMGDNVYNVKFHKMNPVALADHNNSLGSIFGSFIYGGDNGTIENEKGLFFNLRLMDNPKTEIAQHAVELYSSGNARAFSIGGKWTYGDKTNPKILTKAMIYEISGVAVPADAYALASTSKPKSDETTKAHLLEVVEFLISEYQKTFNPDILKTIETIKKGDFNHG